MNLKAVLVVVSVFCIGQVPAHTYETDDAIIVEADPEEVARVKRSAGQEDESLPEVSERACWTRESRTGTCMSIRECYPFVRFPDLTNLETWAIGTKGSCHYEEPSGRQVYGICCQGRGIPDTANSQVIETKQTAQCGKGPRSVPPTLLDDKNRIVGGTEARRGDWPFQVALLNNNRQFCGGSLIDDTHILTAAHCVAHMSSWDVARLSVALQMHTLKPIDPNAIKKRIRRVTRHKSFNSRTLYNDIAILTMESPVVFSDTVSPVCLPTTSDDYTMKDAVVMGWGTIKEGGGQPTSLQQVTVKVQENSLCKQKYQKDSPGTIIPSMLCAAYPGKDSCQGDSGGPLVYQESPESGWLQVGIVSWGFGCAQDAYPGVYTRVTSFLTWIKANLS